MLGSDMALEPLFGIRFGILYSIHPLPSMIRLRQRRQNCQLRVANCEL